MTNLDLPTGPVPQWAAKMACEIANSHSATEEWVPNDFIEDIVSGSMDALARLIQKYVPEPISPELQAAREACLLGCITTDAEDEYLRGDHDDGIVVKACLRAIERFKELEGRGNG